MFNVVTPIVTPPGPVTLSPIFTVPLDDRVTVELLDAIAPFVVKVPALTIFNAPFTAWAFAFTFPVFDNHISPALDLAASEVVAAVIIGAPDAPTAVALVCPRRTVGALNVPAVLVMLPFALRTMLP
ncbi:MAG TPA: hypothetical protein VMV90_07730, partial [Rectinemataceae bacterium]|nr:hypothetical protein [Rectinemataceae bacterium]